MRRAIVGLFKSLNQCERALRELENEGWANNQISIVVKNSASMQNDIAADYSDEITGTTTNGTLQDLEGMLVQVHNIVIPEIGSVSSAGPLAGALLQGDKDLAECLTYYGVSPARAEEIQGNIAQGYALALVETDNSKVNIVANILNGYGAHRVEKWSTSIERPLVPHN